MTLSDYLSIKSKYDQEWWKKTLPRILDKLDPSYSGTIEICLHEK